MTTQEFVNRFYTDKEYTKNLTKEIKKTKSKYKENELLSHKQEIDQLYYNLLLDKVTNEVYPYIKSVNLKEIF